MHGRRGRACICVMDRAPGEGVPLACSSALGHAQGTLDESGVVATGAGPPHDGAGEGVDHEGRGGKPPVSRTSVKSATCSSSGRSRRKSRLTRSGAISALGSRMSCVAVHLSHPAPAMGAHQPFHRAAGNRDPLAAQIRPHLGRPIERLRRTATFCVGLIDAGKDLADGALPEATARRGSAKVGVVGPGSDRTVRALSSARQIGATP